MNICGHYFCWVFFCYDNIKNIKYAINNFINKAFNKAYRDNKKVRNNTNKALKIPPPYDQEQMPDELPRKNFLYMWYLICLYHDIGYVYERNDLPFEALHPDELLKKRCAVHGIPSFLYKLID